MIFISGGCSFSYDEFTWPFKLAEILGAEHYPMALGSSGNELISRRVLYKLNELLKSGKNPKDMLVGIMWSDASRRSFYHTDQWIVNAIAHPHPTQTSPWVWPDNDPDGKWVLINAGFESKYARTWYKMFNDTTMNLINTYEHVLRVQWFCEKHRIKYFFTTMTANTFDETGAHTIQTDYLKDQVNWKNVISIKGMNEWCYAHMPGQFLQPNDHHPSEIQHTEFTNKVILPFIKKRFGIDA